MQNSIPEKTDDEYEREFQQIYKMFPDAKFDILISLKDMDDIITENSYLIVKNSYNCYHYKDWKKPLIASSRPAEYFIIRGEKIIFICKLNNFCRITSISIYFPILCKNIHCKIDFFPMIWPAFYHSFSLL